MSFLVSADGNQKAVGDLSSPVGSPRQRCALPPAAARILPGYSLHQVCGMPCPQWQSAHAAPAPSLRRGDARPAEQAASAFPGSAPSSLPPSSVHPKLSDCRQLNLKRLIHLRRAHTDDRGNLLLIESWFFSL